MSSLHSILAATEQIDVAAHIWWQKWVTLGLMALVLVSLIRNIVPPDAAFMGALVATAALGIITPEQAFHGFGNHGLITVAAMFVVAAGLRETGALYILVSRLLGADTSERAALARIAGPSATLSAFLNNTPIVAILVPEVVSWCRRRGISPSRMLIPLSYATILGGLCTLIGTSTNLVVDGMIQDVGMQAMSLFELGKVGLPVAVVGLAFILIIGPKLLPNRKELIDQLGEAKRKYIVEMIVEPSCPLVGKTIQEAGLRRLPGLFLIEIDRDGEITAPVSPAMELQAMDRLVFTGLVQTIVDLQRTPGLVPAAEKVYDLTTEARRQRRMCEAVVSTSFPELGKNIRSSNFRTRYDAVIVAVHRNGERLRKKIGDIILRPGDTLLIQAGPHFEQTFRASTDFFLVSEVQDSAPVRHDRAWMSLGVLLILLILLSTGVVSTAIAALLAAGLMVLFRCVPIGAARRAVDWQVLVVIAAALGFGQAIQSSGLASLAGDFIVNVGKGVGGKIGVLIAIYLLTNVLCEIISHIGAAVVTFPIAMAAAAGLGVDDPRAFAITIAVAASASFATPIGYQTNLMVYGPGGYRFTDFLRAGLPLNLLIMIVSLAIIPHVWPL